MKKSKFIGSSSWKVNSKTPNPSPDTHHKVVFAIKQKRLKKIERILFHVSDPHSQAYGKFLSRSEVAELTSNINSTEAVLEALRRIDGVVIFSVSIYGEYIAAIAPVFIWESLFQSKFYYFYHKNHKAARMPSFILPASFSEHVSCVFNIIDFPFPLELKKTISPLDLETTAPIYKEKIAQRTFPPVAILNQYVAIAAPSYINYIHNISNNTGNSRGSQLIYSTVNQSYSKADLTSFQATFQLPPQLPIKNINGYVTEGPCKNASFCAEANLDTQWIMAIAQNIPTTVFYDQSADFVTWIELMANYSNPPLVMSISYATMEGYMDPTELDQWNIEAIKLGVQGVTLVAASGDSGVSGFFDDPKYCGYGPVFPCSSPYVTSVGALQPQISESSGKFTISSLVACQSNMGGSATSGGGFSNYYPTPSWQSRAVSTYFNSLPIKPYTNTTGPSQEQQLPQKSYNTKGRGYPDISAWGAYVWLEINGTLHTAAGTSVSAPIVAGMISLVNAQRLQNGLHPL